MSKHRTIRRHTPQRRQDRPSIQAALRRLSVLDVALFAAWTEYDGLAPYSTEACRLLGKIHALRSDYYATYWQLFRSLGYNAVLLKSLTRRG